MGAQVADMTDTIRVDRLVLLSGILPGDGVQAISAAVTMGNIPRQALMSYIAAPGAGSAAKDDVEAAEDHTGFLGGEGMLPEFLPIRPTKSLDRFNPLQKWEGVVLEIHGDTFLARLADLTHPNTAEEVELPIAEVSDADHGLMMPGALFYWTIGYLDDRYGQRQRVSRIRFRRVPAWTNEEIESARQEADRLAERLGWK